MEICYNNSQWDPIRVCARKIKCGRINLLKMILRCINAVGCVKKLHAPIGAYTKCRQFPQCRDIFQLASFNFNVKFWIYQVIFINLNHYWKFKIQKIFFKYWIRESFTFLHTLKLQRMHPDFVMPTWASAHVPWRCNVYVPDHQHVYPDVVMPTCATARVPWCCNAYLSSTCTLTLSLLPSSSKR